MNDVLNNELDASRVLAAALKQMDEIINGSNNEAIANLQDHPDNQQCYSAPSSADVAFFIKSLKSALERNGVADGNGNQSKHPNEDIDKETLLFISKWLRNEMLSRSQSNDSSYECEDLQQRICQLEMEKEQLALQEMASRSSMENSKLDLMTQISALRLRLSTVEEEKKEIEERNRKLENELILTCACLAEKEADLATIKSKIARNGTVSPAFDCSPEMERLKGALSTVMAANDEKERKIQEMKTSLNRYKKLHELVLSNRTRKNSEEFSSKVPSEEDNIFSALENLAACDLNDVKELSVDYNLAEKPPLVPRSFQQSATLLSICEDYQRPPSRPGDISRLSPHFSPIRTESPSPFSSLNAHRYNSSENVSPPTPQKTPPSKRHYSTLPRPHQTEILSRYVKSPNQPSQAGMSLAPDKLEEGSCSPKLEQSFRKQSSPLPVIPTKEKSKGLRKIFGKVKRTGSENLNSSAAEFKRGGIRATAGPRLGWSEDLKVKRGSFRVNQPFSEWDSTLICDWLVSLGLSMYAPDCKKWVKNGDQLLKASTSDFEKELNIKNPLHRKKLLLAINGAKEQTGDVVEPAGKIDHQWVVRWLDDIGLPQYKDAFYDARVDGRMLHQLTLEDLSHLKVMNLLHHISIKTGIQVLRENNFDPVCLQRRSLPDEDKSKEDVRRWTNHRVMEWLITVDLSEYAPNLRGSGVHGGLMMYEHRFNADLMATLLNIPPNKTLLRRHLSTQFKQLIGPEVMQKKREWEAQATYTPISPSAKIKTLKRSPFSLGRKKNKNEFDHDDYVCPMNSNEKGFDSMLLNGAENRTEEEKFLMKEIVLKNDKILESMPASNV